MSDKVLSREEQTEILAREIYSGVRSECYFDQAHDLSAAYISRLGRIAELESFQANYDHATKLERAEHDERLTAIAAEAEAMPHALNCHKLSELAGVCNCARGRLLELAKGRSS